MLQGFRADADFNRAKRLLTALDVVPLGGLEVCVQAAQHFRGLRRRGITVRKTIDTLIATCCIQNDYALLYSDRDFDPFVEHLELRTAFVRGR